MANNSNFNYSSEIWNIADYVRNIIKPKDYNRVILPFTLLRRLECALEETRDDVYKEYKKGIWGEEHDHYCSVSHKAFYNLSTFKLNNIPSSGTFDALWLYINSFSPNAREVLLAFKIEETARILDKNYMLYEVCRRFSSFDLSPESVSDREMSNIYEHLIQRFGEEIAEGAEDFMTPRDVVRLAVSLIFAGDDELMNSDSGIIRTLYDPTIGTAGFISDALDMLSEWHSQKKMTSPALIVPYGQEIESESWAIGKANLMLRNVASVGDDRYDKIKDMSSHIQLGDTLADDKFSDTKFDYILSNPPYGKKWETSEAAVKEEHSLGFKGRFGAGLPPIDDGSMLFLSHVVSKLKNNGKAGIVLSGSPLFNGDAGSGTSNIRRWSLKQDVFYAIIKLPSQVFFRTGINTYLWIINKNKNKKRQGMLQLIDASNMKTQRRKSLGKKRFDISSSDIQKIVSLYTDGVQNDVSVFVKAEDFMYRKVITYRPLHAKLDIKKELYENFFLSSKKLSDLEKEKKQKITEYFKNNTGLKEYKWADDNAKAILDIIKTDRKTKITKSDITKAIQNTFITKDPSYPIIYDDKGKVVKDPDTKDYEKVPFNTDIEEYMKKEVLPFESETFVDESVTDNGVFGDGGIGVVGTEITFNKYFYKYTAPRSIDEIESEISELEKVASQGMASLFK